MYADPLSNLFPLREPGVQWAIFQFFTDSLVQLKISLIPAATEEHMAR